MNKFVSSLIIPIINTLHMQSHNILICKSYFIYRWCTRAGCNNCLTLDSLSELQNQVGSQGSFVESQNQLLRKDSHSTHHTPSDMGLRNQANKTKRKLPLTVSCSCGQKFCYYCGAEPHEPATCDMVENWSQLIKDSLEDLTHQYLRNNSK